MATERTDWTFAMVDLAGLPPWPNPMATSTQQIWQSVSPTSYARRSRSAARQWC